MYLLGKLAHVAGFAGQKPHQNVAVAGGDVAEPDLFEFRKDEAVARFAEAAGMGENSAVLHGETFSSISNYCQGPEKAARLKAAYFFLPVQYESIIPINLL